MSEKELKLYLNEHLVKEITYGVQSTLTSIVGIVPEAQEHRIGAGTEHIRGDVSGIISVMQDSLNGTFVVTFPKQTILAILSRIYRKPFAEINASVQSGVGELTNMIYGVLKTNLNKRGYSLKMALPSVILGEKHTIVHCAGGAVLTLPFKTQEGGFTVSLIIAPPAASQQNAA